jgi:hypothetical protein
MQFAAAMLQYSPMMALESFFGENPRTKPQAALSLSMKWIKVRWDNNSRHVIKAVGHTSSSNCAMYVERCCQDSTNVVSGLQLKY